MAKSKKKLIKECLIRQLERKKKTGTFFNDMIDDYIHFYDLKKELFDDIKNRGVMVETTNGNGFKVMKQNESVQNVLKVNTQMLKILNDLELKEPMIDDSDDKDEDYL